MNRGLHFAAGVTFGGGLDSVAARLARLKWFCWHCNVFRALQTVEDIEFDLDTDDDAGPEQRKLLQGRRRVRRLPAGQRREHPQLRGAPPGRGRSSPVPPPSPPSTRWLPSGW